MKNPSLLFPLSVALLCVMPHAMAQAPAAAKPVKLIVLDPGHFHAALLQKTMYPQVDPIVHIYAPAGDDVKEHLKRISAYNTRADNPTAWKAETYTGRDYFERLLKDKAGNVVVMSGNNRGKPARIMPLLEAGMHVFADKPVIIEPADFEPLHRAFAAAQEKNVVLYDIMTERSEITNALQREFTLHPTLFGKLATGTPENPAIVMESVHYFRKTVSGVPLKRPAWFFDVTQEGEGMVDVGTHLIDLVQWEGFPNQVLDHAKDIEVQSARHWPTPLTAAQFKTVTGLGAFPDFLKGSVKGGTLNVFANGEINYRIKGHHAKVTIKWDYEAPPGAADAHYSLIRGTKCNLVIRQGATENYKPTLYLEAAEGTDPIAFRRLLMPALLDIQRQFPGVDVKPLETSWQVVVPEKYDIGHEAHFAEVTNRFLKYVATGKLPEWEVPNMLAKYYTTTKGLEMARSAK